MSSVMELCSSAMRGCIAAPPGKKLCVADLANIEGRVLAWLVEENWKLKAFSDYDAGVGPDLYKVAYAKSFGIDVGQVTKPQRQIGKVEELQLGYQGGIGAFVTMANLYNMDLQNIADTVYGALATVDPRIVQEAKKFWIWGLEQGRTLGLDEHVFVACDIIKRGWREGHVATASYWPELEQSTIKAVQQPGVTVKARRIKIRRDGSWLRLQLPSGRHLCYFNPSVSEDGKLSYQGVNPYTRKWERVNTYGGRLVENACQALARDVLADNMPRIEAAGYAIGMLVHDEIIAEADDVDAFSGEHLAELMSVVPEWAEGLPLAAEGFTAYRYRK